MRQSPWLHGFQRSRWTLQQLCQATRRWLRVKTAAGMWQVLHRLAIHYKRARSYIHSPDPDYQAKVKRIEQLKQRVQESQGQEVLLFQDEMSYYRQPSLSRAYEEAGSKAPLARRSRRYDDITRVVGTLDAHSGRVLFWQGAKVGVSPLVSFYEQGCAAYPQARRIWLVQDNSFVHFHPDVLVALEAQESPFPFLKGHNWPDQPSPRQAKKWAEHKLPIQLVQLPTYASWCNPIEKLWRKAKQEVIHLHSWADDLETLRTRTQQFFAGFAQGSTDLLRSVGLHVPY